MGDSRSLVRWYAKKDQQKCGYCNSREEGSITFGMWAHNLRVEDYQTLIDRGWRRSGQYCYKAVMHETCCPLYTIRCHALEFRPTKSQKKIMKKMNKFLKTGLFKNSDTRELSETDDIESCEERKAVKECPNNLSNIETLPGEGDFDNASKSESSDDGQSTPCVVPSTENSQHGSDIIQPKIYPTSKVRAFKKGLGPDPTRPPCKKAKIRAHEKKNKKTNNSVQDVETQVSKPDSKSLEEFIKDISDDDKHKLTIKLIEPTNPSCQWKKYEQLEFELFKKYQMIIHEDPPHKNNLEGFLRFLVKTPLKGTVHPDHQRNRKVPPYGSFHQQYWLDDKLIAVGVIDILPKCVSGVYFFYDPDYRDLTLGTYGALREIELTRELHPLLDIQYYYMGFYVHDCQKMKYKGNMHPSDLLCPETYQWFPIERCLKELEKTKYCRFNDDQTAGDPDECTDEHLDSLRLISGQQYMTYRTFKKTLKSEEAYKIIGRLIGRKAAKSLIFIES